MDAVVKKDVRHQPLRPKCHHLMLMGAYEQLRNRNYLFLALPWPMKSRSSSSRGVECSVPLFEFSDLYLMQKHHRRRK